MVMGIADGQLRFQRRLLGQREPVIASEWHDRTSEVMRVNQRLAGIKPGGPPFYLPALQRTIPDEAVLGIDLGEPPHWG
jgi:hypothetical protein